MAQTFDGGTSSPGLRNEEISEPQAPIVCKDLEEIRVFQNLDYGILRP
jgi:hypothetical protein